jgi:predicted DNA-binding protein
MKGCGMMGTKKGRKKATIKVRENYYMRLKTSNKLEKMSKDIRCSKSHLVNEAIEFANENIDDFAGFVSSRLSDKETTELGETC